MATCPNCGNETGPGAIFCDQCGTRLPSAEAAPAPAAGSVICPSCGAGNVPGEAFCDACGAPLEAPAPAPAEPVAPEAEPGEAPAAAAGEPTCPACGAAIVPGDAFCADCGAALAEAEPAAEAEAEPAAEEPPAEAEPAEAPPAEAESAEAPAEPVEAAPTCPACGAGVTPADTFCSACGASLTAAPAPVAPEAEPVAPAAEPVAPAAEPVAPEAEPVEAPAPVPMGRPFLTVVSSGAHIPLPGGPEIVIGREDPVSGIYPEIDLTPHGGEEGGVSRQHARITVVGDAFSVEDLNSTNFTFVNKQQLTPRVPQPLADGDELRCGRVVMTFHTG